MNKFAVSINKLSILEIEESDFFINAYRVKKINYTRETLERKNDVEIIDTSIKNKGVFLDQNFSFISINDFLNNNTANGYINSKTKKLPIRISKDKDYIVSLKSKRHILIATKDSISEIRNKYVKFYSTLLSKDIKEFNKWKV